VQDSREEQEHMQAVEHPLHQVRQGRYKITRLGSTASQVVRLIGLLLVFASQKVVHKVRNEMAESIVPLRKKIKDV